MKRLNKKVLVAILSATGIMMLAGCASSDYQMLDTIDAAAEYDYGGSYLNSKNASYSVAIDSFAEDAYYEESFDSEVQGVQNDASFNSNNEVADGRKLIVTVGLDIETDEYDKFVEGVNKAISDCKGYIEYEYSDNGSAYSTYSRLRNATLTVRIPNTELDNFVNAVSGIGHITSKTKSTEDVTLQYVDTESKKEMYLAEQESLLALLEKAETIEDITYLTERLTDVRYQIEAMESTLRVYDDLVDYATINLYVSEVEVYTAPSVVVEKTTAEQIKEGFSNSLNNVLNGLKNFFVNLIINLPYIIRTIVILAIIAGIIFGVIKLVIAIIKKKIKKHNAKKQIASENVTSQINDDKAKEEKSNK